MKKLFYILVSAIVALGAVACNNEFDENIEANTTCEGVSFTVALDEEASRVIIGDREEGTHTIYFSSEDVIYAESSELGKYTFETTDGKTFVCEEPSSKGKLPFEMIGKELEFYNFRLPYSDLGSKGVTMTTTTTLNKSNETVTLTVGSPVLALVAPVEGITLHASESIFSYSPEAGENANKVLDTFEVEKSETDENGNLAVQYVPIQFSRELDFWYTIGDDANAVKQFTKKFETKIYNLGTLSAAVASVNGVNYTELTKAFAAVEEGGTVELAADYAITEENRHEIGEWYDGIYYLVDKSFTIDLKENSITNEDGASNDYIVFLKNSEEGAEHTITIKNGTIDAGTAAFSALATSSSGNKGLTVNLENVTLKNNNTGGAAIKLRGGAVMNIGAGTKIIAENSYSGIEAAGTETVLNIYDGAEIYQNGTPNNVGSLVGASFEATVNVYGGKGESAKYGLMVFTSGGVLNAMGGEWKAAQKVLAAQNDKASYPEGGPSLVFVNGGTYVGDIEAWIGTWGNQYGAAAGVTVENGFFSVDPTAYLKDPINYKAVYDESTELYTIVAKVPAAGIEGDETVYESIEDAFEAAAAMGTQVTVNIVGTDENTGNSINYTSFPASKLNENITVDAQGATFVGSSSLNVNGATVKNANFSNESGNVCGSSINGIYENCTFEGNNAFRYCYASDTVIFRDCTFTENGGEWLFHFDGAATGSSNPSIICERCIFDGDRVAIGGAVKHLTMTDCTFVNGRYFNFYNDATITNCEFDTSVRALGGHAVVLNSTKNGEEFTFDSFTTFTGYDFTAEIGADEASAKKYAFVSTSAKLNDAIANLSDHEIVLASTTFEGLFYINDKDINMRALKSRQAIIDGKIAIAATNNTINLSGIHFKNNYSGNVDVGHQYLDKTKTYCIGLYCGNVNVDDCEFTLSKDGGIQFYSMVAGNYCTVTNSKFNCNGFRPIRSKVNVTVDNCEFIDQNKYALQIWGLNNDGNEKVVFTNNKFTNAGKTSGNDQKECMVSGIGVSQSYPISNVEFVIEGNEAVSAENNAVINYVYDENDIVLVETFTTTPGIVWMPEGGAVAKVGEVYYASMSKAIAAAGEGGTVTLLKGKEFNFGALAIAPNEITFEGEDKTAKVIMNKSIYLEGKKVTFKNLTYDAPAGLNYTEQDFAFIHHTDELTFDDCVINRLRINVDKATIKNSTFEVVTNGGFDGYGLFYYGNNKSNVLVEDCTFNTLGKAIVAYNEGPVEMNLTVNGTTFNSTDNTQKAAISIHAEYGIYGTLTINESTATGFKDFNGGLWREVNNNNGTDTNNFVKTINGKRTIADGVVLDLNNNIYEISNKAGMFWFNNEVNVNNNNFEGYTVMMTQDIDLENEEWTPVGQQGATTFAGKFDGNNKTLYNLSITTKVNTAGYASGLFGWIVGSGESIENLNIDGATIEGYHYVATIVGHLSAGADVKNCSVANATIVADPYTLDTDGERNGDKVGAIVGMAYDGSEVTGNKATNVEISAYRHTGGIIGYTYGTVSGNTIENVTITVENGTNSYAKKYKTVSEYGVNSIVGVAAEGSVVENNSGKATLDFGDIKNDVVYMTTAIGWESDNAVIAAYSWNGGEDAWTEMTKEGDYYKVVLPAGHENVIFVRLNPAGGLNWESKWNQTIDLVVPATFGNNVYTITGWNDNEGAWGAY